ncbi:MAG TPA: hypothetical protein VN581_09240 [Patescibacteria group bacterium]|nr:hypothetical protein [Patescibacteria group bacterium]
MSLPPRTTAKQTPRGFEIVEPAPGFLRFVLIATILLFAVPTCSMWMDGALGDTASALAYVFGAGSLIAGVVLFAVLLWFDRHSSFLFRFERGRLVRLFRVGPVTIWRSEWQPAAVIGCEALIGHTPPALRLKFAGAKGATIPFADGSDDEVRTAHAHIEAWRADPSLAPSAREHLSTTTLIAETAVAGVLMRLKTAPALLVVGTALLIVGNAVHLLRNPTQSLVENTPYDTTAPGELIRYRILVRAPNAEERALNHSDGKAWIEIGVRWRDDSGASHEHWWRSSEDVDLWMLPESRLWPLARSIGLPWLEFQIPAEAAPAWRNAQGRLDWTEIDARPSGDDETLASQRNLVRSADQPIDHLAVLHFAITPDWTMAYTRGDPSSAVLKRWADAERRAHREVPMAALIPLLVVGAFVAVIAGALWLFGRRIALGAAVMIAIVAASPWWAAQSTRIPQWLGLDADLASSIVALFRTAAPLSARQHEYLVPLAAPTPERTELLMRWTPEGARAAELLQRLGLADPELVVDPVDFGHKDHDDALNAATAALLAPVHRRILAWSDAELVDFLKPLHEGRHDRFNVILGLMPGCLLAAQSERSQNTREWIAAVLRQDCTASP